GYSQLLLPLPGAPAAVSSASISSSSASRSRRSCRIDATSSSTSAALTGEPGREARRCSSSSSFFRSSGPGSRYLLAEDIVTPHGTQESNAQPAPQRAPIEPCVLPEVPARSGKPRERRRRVPHHPLEGAGEVR